MKQIVTLALILLMLGCRKDSVSFDTFEEAINTGGDFQPIITSHDEVPGAETEDVVGQELWSCQTKTVKIQDGLGGDQGFSLFNPNAAVIFPGNLLQGNSLYQATPDDIPTERSGGTISIDIFDGSPVSFASVDQVKLSSITQAANDILAEKNAESVIPANFSYQRSVVQSERELALKIRAHYENAWTQVKGSLSFSEHTTYSRVLVQLDQSFYSMSFDTPSSIDGFFSPDANPNDLSRFISPGNPPCYISSVTYGRIFYMLIEASGKESELKAAVDAAFNATVSSGGGSVEASAFNKFSEVNVKIYAFGGNAQVTLQTASLNKNNLSELNNILVKATDIRTAKPISYVVKSVKTNEIVAVQLATEYTLRECFITSALPPPVRTEHWSELTEILGAPVGAAVGLYGSNNITMFFDETGTKYVIDDSDELSGPYTLSDLPPGFPLADVGAGGRYIYGSGGFNGTYFIDKRGKKYVHLAPNGYTYSEVRDISQHPAFDRFHFEGIGAATEGDTGFFTLDKSGLYLNNYFYAGGGNVTVPSAILCGSWESDFAQEGIGAMMRLEHQLYAIVNLPGTRYMIFDFDGNKNYGPFKL